VDLHRVRRLSSALVASQLRSGRTTSDPQSVYGRPLVIALYDVLAFLFGAAAAGSVLPSLGLDASQLASATDLAAPYVPLLAVGTVLLAGVMFELTTTSKFAGSDAANWLPITPTEYVAASSSAIAYTYSPVVSLVLGGLLPVALLGGALSTWVLSVAFAASALVEGAALVEMVRATTQQTAGASTGRRGILTALGRALVLAVVLLVLDLAFNPVFLIRFLSAVPASGLVATLVPVFWPTEALAGWASGNFLAAAAFTAGQTAFVLGLVALAGALRARYWVPSPPENAPAGSAPTGGHPLLRAVGLSEAEAAITAKDLRGYLRRRELLPTLVVPGVLILLLLLEGNVFTAGGPLTVIVWGGWVSGFFALLLAARAIGQERRSLQWLYAYPLTSRSILKAKVAAVLIPGLVGTALIGAVVAADAGLGLLAAAGLIVVMLAAATVLGLWGLVFATRFSDFQDRPRPQFIRSWAMLAAVGSGMVLLFLILVPGAIALAVPTPYVLGLALWTVLFTGGAGALALYLAATGFATLFQELPF
jgi:hypothetical protein